MYDNMTYAKGKPVQVGDILLHRRWNKGGNPVKLEVVKSNLFGSPSYGKLTVVLRVDDPHGYHSRDTSALPQRNGGEASVTLDEIRFLGRGNPAESVFAIPKKTRERREHNDDEY